MYFALPRRRRVIESNLHHAFPGRPAEWRQQIGRESCRRVVETGLLSLATPFLPEKRLRSIVALDPSLTAVFAMHRRDPAATLICSPHIAYWEAQPAMPLGVSEPFPEFGTIYRPLDHQTADTFVKASRERFGMRLLSRKEGFAEALKILRRRGFVGVLFDQNAGLQGALTLLFDRVCSTTELPGLMAEKFSARVYGIYPRRLGFWKVEIHAKLIPYDGRGESVTLGLNRWLEESLRADDDLCASWLWAHDRWRNQDIPAQRFRLEAKRNLLSADLAARGGGPLPRRTRIWIRLPNWLGDVVMALPLIRALRASRPDAEITLVGKGQYLSLLEQLDLADRYEALPAQGFGYWSHFRGLRDEHIDVWLLFTNSTRGDLEAWCAGARQRFGLVRPGKPRPLLTHRYPLAGTGSDVHQLRQWTAFCTAFGLHGEIDLRPLTLPNTSDSALIGLIPGSENTPEKRWPVAHWRALIETHPRHRFMIFGTPNDAAIAAEVAAGFAPDRVVNVAGQTNLTGFAAALDRCRVLVTNDTGGMHLANARGVPVIGLFGPTNPLRTGPVFTAPRRLLQPPGCPPTGGARLADLKPESVAAALQDLAALPAL
jgi:heptosyltransferase-2